MTITQFQSWLNDPNRKPMLMGVLNVTPDSFSDGGRFAMVESAVEHAGEMTADGAAVIDVGGESTRPGSQSVPEEEQIRRVVPVIREISSLPALISIDTTRAAVAEAAVDAGATLINDISAGTDDPSMLALAGRLGVAVALMHMKGRPATMQQAPAYSDVVSEVTAFLAGRIDAAISAGIARSRILIDPGIGFGKTTPHNLTLLRRLSEFHKLGCPLLVGTSRKKFIGDITGEADPASRLFGTAASVAWSIANGASMLRVHDVRPMAQVLKLIESIKSA